jgi:hypothetical protein
MFDHALRVQLDRIEEFLIHLHRKFDTMALDLSVLTANETKLVGDVDTLLTANTKAVADLVTANALLAAALAVNDPVAVAAVQAQIDAIATALAAEDAKITPAIPAQPPAA